MRCCNVEGHEGDCNCGHHCDMQSEEGDSSSLFQAREIEIQESSGSVSAGLLAAAPGDRTDPEVAGEMKVQEMINAGAGERRAPAVAGEKEVHLECNEAELRAPAVAGEKKVHRDCNEAADAVCKPVRLS